MAAQPPKTVLITGGSEGGIGEALARQFHLRGLRVFATALDLKEVEGLKAIGITVLSLDITDSGSIAEVVASVSKATGGTLDFLVNNAGIGEGVSFWRNDQITFPCCVAGSSELRVGLMLVLAVHQDTRSRCSTRTSEWPRNSSTSTSSASWR
jgi:NAD(P)-dependent dehydrogenase (short-subunit alcohol dehydrogenase family)